MEDLKIKLKIERMIVYGYSALRQFPKSEKHTLAAEIRQCMYELLRLVLTTNRRHHKKTTASAVDTELDVLRSLIRISHELGFLPIRKYQIWSEHLYEIGCMIGDWQNTLILRRTKRPACFLSTPLRVAGWILSASICGRTNGACAKAA